MKFSACIELLFPDTPFLDRIGRAKACGFSHVEFWLWTNKNVDAVGERLSKEGMKLGVFQGNNAGRMVDPLDHNKYCDSVRESFGVAKKLGCSNLFCMTDILREDRTVDPGARALSFVEKEEAVVSVLKELAPEAKKQGITLLAEPLNTLVDHAGYFIEKSQIAWRINELVNHPNAKVLYDIYHMQIMEGNIISTIKDHIDAIGYVHVADVPGRNEPGTGELNFHNIVKALKSLRYGGVVGFEYSPTVATEESLKVARAAFGF